LIQIAGTLGWWAAVRYGDSLLGKKDTNFKACCRISVLLPSNLNFSCVVDSSCNAFVSAGVLLQENKHECVPFHNCDMMVGRDMICRNEQRSYEEPLCNLVLYVTIFQFLWRC